MKKRLEADFTVNDRLVQCPLGGKSYVVSVEGTCKACPFIVEVTEKDSEKAIPAKVNCEPPIKHFNTIFDFKSIDWDSTRERKEE